ncbi:MAG TPA: hypothetical protein VIH85_11850, partial [Solirubrobacteraceae bacterium]
MSVFPDFASRHPRPGPRPAIAPPGGSPLAGLAAAATIAALALPLGTLVPRVSAPIIALALGMAVSAA